MTTDNYLSFNDDAADDSAMVRQAAGTVAAFFPPLASPLVLAEQS
jgi:hypothetical protein